MCWFFAGHPWIQVDGVAPDKPLDSAVLSRLKQFSVMNKLKKMALKVIFLWYNSASRQYCYILTYNTNKDFLSSGNSNQCIVIYMLTSTCKRDNANILLIGLVKLCNHNIFLIVICRLLQTTFQKKKFLNWK